MNLYATVMVIKVIVTKILNKRHKQRKRENCKSPTGYLLYDLTQMFSLTLPAFP